MANIKQQKKRVRTNEDRRQRNVAVRSRLRTFVKQADEAIQAGQKEQIDAAVKAAITEIDVAARKGVIHKNTAARKKSRLQRKAATSGS